MWYEWSFLRWWHWLSPGGICLSCETRREFISTGENRDHDNQQRLSVQTIGPVQIDESAV